MAAQKRILIAGGAYTDIPLIKAARALGFYVATTGNRPGDLGHRYSDEYRDVDYSDREALLELAADLKVDAVCPCASDISAQSCSYVAEKLGLHGHDPLEVSEVIHHKDKFRRFAMEYGLSSPRAYAVSDGGTPDDLAFPVIVKPIDQQAGRGATRVDDAGGIGRAIEYARSVSRSKKIVVEEFIEGTNHGITTFIRGGQVAFHFHDNEHRFLNKYLVSGASTPSSVPKAAVDFLIEQFEKIAALLKLTDGILHVQFILKGDTPYILEICRRQPGDLYVDFVRHATGVDYPAYIVKAFAGMDISDLSQVGPVGCFTRHVVMSGRAGRVKDVVFDKSIEKNVFGQFMWWKKGDEITDVLMQRFGIVFLRYGSMAEMREKAERLQELIKVEVDG